MKAERCQIRIADGRTVGAIAPVILSVSRATDIPAFHGDWLRHRLEAGYAQWINPYNGQPLYISFARARVMVFWSKNPEPMLEWLDQLDARGINYYFQFTLNDYTQEGYEPGLPALAKRIETFQKLSERLGKARVIWRYDPVMVTPQCSLEQSLEKIAGLGEQLAAFTEQLIFSFVDLVAYPRACRRLQRAGIVAQELSMAQMQAFAAGVQQLNRAWKLRLGSCAETIDLSAYGVEHSRCIDDALLVQCFAHDGALMRHLGYAQNLFGEWCALPRKMQDKDAGQRKACGCVESKDIGRYNTCLHRCVYCYANGEGTSTEAAFARCRAHPDAEALGG